MEQKSIFNFRKATNGDYQKLPCQKVAYEESWWNFELESESDCWDTGSHSAHGYHQAAKAINIIWTSISIKFKKHHQ